MGQAAEEQLTRDIEMRRAELSRDLDALSDKISPSQMVERRKAAARGKVRSMRDKVMGTARDAQHKMTPGGSGTGSSMSGAVDSVAGGAQGAKETLERQTEGSPLAAGLVAFGAGWLISALMPTSEKEARAAHQLVESAKDSPLMDEARSIGQEMGDNLKESASDAAQEVKSTAEDSVQTVKDEGQSSAESVKQDGQHRAEHVQQDVQGGTD